MKVKAFEFSSMIDDEIINDFISDKKVVDIKITSLIEQKDPFYTRHIHVLVMYE